MLTIRQRVGLNLAPILLRVVLGAIFLWAGLGKVSDRFEPQGADATILAGMGVIAAPPAGAAAKAQDAPKVSVLAVHRLALLIHKSAAPPAAPAGEGASAGGMRLWPPALASGAWPVRFAWAAAITELVGGACLILGLLTRFWGLALAGVMLTAMWLTEIGPAMQAGNTVLGILPAYDAFSPQAWQRFMFQTCCLAMALSIAALGAGRLAIDHVVFAPRATGDEDDDD